MCNKSKLSILCAVDSAKVLPLLDAALKADDTPLRLELIGVHQLMYNISNIYFLHVFLYNLHILLRQYQNKI